jgi:HEAT repeat protein
MTDSSWKFFTIAFLAIVVASIILLPPWSSLGSSLDIEDTPLYLWGVDDDRYEENLSTQFEQIINPDLGTDSPIPAFPEDDALGSTNSNYDVEEDIGRSDEILVDNSDIEGLFESVGHPYWKVRLDSINELGLLQDERAIPVLIESALHDDNRHPRWRSSQILKSVDRSGSISIPRFLIELGSDDHVVVRNAAVGLALMGDNRGVKELINGLDDVEFFRRWEAVFMIGLLGDTKAALPLRPLLKEHIEPNAQIRKEVAVALGRIGFSDDSFYLLEAIRNDTDKRVREAAVNAITNIGNNEVISELEKLQLIENDIGVRQLIGESIRSLR